MTITKMARKMKEPRVKKEKRSMGLNRKENPWLVHVKRYMLEHTDLKYRDVLSGAKESYVKTGPVKREKEPGELKRPNPWMEHIQRWKDSNPDWKTRLSYKDVLKQSKDTYKKA